MYFLISIGHLYTLCAFSSARDCDKPLSLFVDMFVIFHTSPWGLKQAWADVWAIAPSAVNKAKGGMWWYGWCMSGVMCWLCGVRWWLCGVIGCYVVVEWCMGGGKWCMG
jgi:hypothetical protein